jgi:predicted transcriptional regulator
MGEVTMVSGQQEIAELDRRWNAFLLQGRAVSSDEVVSWLRTWGTSDFEAWRPAPLDRDDSI